MAQDALPLWMVMMESGEIVYNYLIAADLSTNNNDGTCSHTSILAYVDSGWIGDLDGSTESINCGDILYVDDSVGESLSVSAWVTLTTRLMLIRRSSAKITQAERIASGVLTLGVQPIAG